MTRRDRFAVVATALFFAMGLILLWPIGTLYVREFWLVDQCLNVGGSFDYARMTCDDHETHPYIPLTVRNEDLPTRLIAGVALLAAASFVHLRTLARHWRSRR
jgi:hypothetical protein